MPTYLLELCLDPLSDTTPTWTDVTAYLLEASYTRDGGGDLDDPQAGTATFVLDNRDRRFEPEYAAGALFPFIKPLRRMRFTIDGDVEFMGFVTSWGVDWPDQLFNEEVSVSCADGCHLVELEALPGLEPSDASSYDEVVGFDQPWGYWRLGEPEGTKVVTHVRYRHGGKWKGESRRNRRYKIHDRLTRAEVEGVAGPSGTYKGLPTLGVPGLILGDPDTAVTFDGSSQYARIGPLDASDMVDSNVLTLEAWVKMPSASGVQTVISGPSAGSLGGSVFSLGAGPKAAFSVGFTDSTTLEAPGTTLLASNTIYHLVGTWDGQEARIYVNGALDGSDTANGKRLQVGDPDEFLRIGRNANASFPFYFGGTIDEPAIYEKALSPQRVLAHYIAGAQRGYAQQSAGDRLRAILTHDLWSTSGIQNTGGFQVQPQMQYGQTMMEEAAQTWECEKPQRVFYFNGSGDPVYLTWNYGDSSPYNSVQYTFGDSTGEVPYEDVNLDYDEEIYNEITVAADGGETQMASDSASEDDYRLRRYQQSGLILASDDDAATVSGAILETFSQPVLRVNSLTLNGLDPSALTAMLALTPGHLIRVKRRPKGGTAIDRVCRVQSKSITIPRGGPKVYPVCTLQLTRGFNAALSQWHLGTSGFAELGSTAVLA